MNSYATLPREGGEGPTGGGSCLLPHPSAPANRSAFVTRPIAVLILIRDSRFFMTIYSRLYSRPPEKWSEYDFGRAGRGTGNRGVRILGTEPLATSPWARLYAL